MAIALLRPAAAIAPYSIPVHGELGRALFRQRRYDAALDHFERARYSDEKLADLHGRAASSLDERGAFAEAIHHYEQAMVRADRGLAKHSAHGVVSQSRELQRKRRAWSSRLKEIQAER